MASEALNFAEQADKTNSAEQIFNEQRFWDASAKYNPSISIPGYWDALEKNCNQWSCELSVCPFWKFVKDKKSTWTNEFWRKASGSLFAQPTIPDFVGKKKERIQRKIISQHRSDPKKLDPEYFWKKNKAPVPHINDLVRTRIECLFLDGVEFLTDALESTAQNLNIKYARSREGRLEGYFAQHFYFEQKVFFRFGGGEEVANVKCEVQVATALATRIWDESHKIYEASRDCQASDVNWQWNPTDSRFIARQLGHMIHLADGLLVQLRNSNSTQSKIK